MAKAAYGRNKKKAEKGRHPITRSAMKKIPLIKPYVTEEVKAKVCEVIDSGHLTEGAVTRELEQAFKNYLGCKYAIATTSCTTGLEMALKVLGVGPGSEVIVPDYTYPATADAVAIVGAEVVIVDVDRETMLIAYDKLEQAITQKTKAIIPVSLFGNPLDYHSLSAIKDRYGLYIVEDAACSIGAEYNGTRVGNLADITVFSLHPRKVITTGEGGMITTNDPKWAEWINSYKRFGMRAQAPGKENLFERIGTNYKLSDLLSAVGLVQMRHLDELLTRRIYIHLLENNGLVRIPKITSSGKHSRQSFCVHIENRDKVMSRLRELGIEVQIGTYSLHMHPAFSPGGRCKIFGDMTGSKYAFHQCLSLPMYHEMTDEDQETVVNNLVRLL
jgi:dTDP-4-amino-4,6-dideoxygalactose transaminase